LAQPLRRVSKNAKWGGKDYKRMLWLKPGYTLVGGVISGPNTWELDTEVVDSSKGELGKGFYTSTQGSLSASLKDDHEIADLDF
jgi:hypothetical protein